MSWSWFHPSCDLWRGSSNLEGDIPGQVPETYVPCWGVIEDHFRELLPFGLLADLGDVSSIAPTSGQALIWDGSEWKPSSDIAADVSNNSITDLADVNTAGVQLDDILRWDGGNWVATPQLVSIFGPKTLRHAMSYCHPKISVLKTTKNFVDSEKT